MKPRLRLSLMNLLLITTTVATAIAVFVVQRGSDLRVARLETKLATAATEIGALRRQLGVLSIDDPQRAYAVFVENRETVARPGRWRLRVHFPEVPEKSMYTVFIVGGRIRGDGTYPNWDYPLNVPSRGVGLKSGEYTLDLTLVEPDDSNKDWRIAFSFFDSNARRSGTAELQDFDGKWLLRGSHVTTSETPAVGRQKEFDPLKPIPLLRYRKPFPTGDSSPKVTDTLLVFAEPYAPNAKPQPLSGPQAAAYLSELVERDANH